MKRYIAPELIKTVLAIQNVIASSPLYDYLQKNGYEDNTRSFSFDDAVNGSEE